jgi:hypothetical protein
MMLEVDLDEAVIEKSADPSPEIPSGSKPVHAKATEDRLHSMSSLDGMAPKAICRASARR